MLRTISADFTQSAPGLLAAKAAQPRGSCMAKKHVTDAFTGIVKGPGGIDNHFGVAIRTGLASISVTVIACTTTIRWRVHAACMDWRIGFWSAHTCTMHLRICVRISASDEKPSSTV